ncbi:hypothetical protein PE066_19105 [Ramlibacter tataouinensis]|uniref:hypothetical protein n=1 Tax=Ramlibacter tataouinensis TaxID=94132 RepID=UPI0022F38829|nr:hypothetical protein [Ramlibacter tataouinensis]WBY01547.1 hypothetical protein PE066_19105 [Ramlibacter tataouinensis]
MITGIEQLARGPHSKANVMRHRQTWWCMVHTLSAAQSVGLGDVVEDEVFDSAPGGSLQFLAVPQTL